MTNLTAPELPAHRRRTPGPAPAREPMREVNQNVTDATPGAAAPTLPAARRGDEHGPLGRTHGDRRPGMSSPLSALARSTRTSTPSGSATRTRVEAPENVRVDDPARTGGIGVTSRDSGRTRATTGPAGGAAPASGRRVPSSCTSPSGQGRGHAGSSCRRTRPRTRSPGRSYSSSGARHLLQPPVAQDADPVGHRQRLGLVVGDEDGRDAELELDAAGSPRAAGRGPGRPAPTAARRAAAPAVRPRAPGRAPPAAAGRRRAGAGTGRPGRRGRPAPAAPPPGRPARPCPGGAPAARRRRCRRR